MMQMPNCRVGSRGRGREQRLHMVSSHKPLFLHSVKDHWLFKKNQVKRSNLKDEQFTCCFPNAQSQRLMFWRTCPTGDWRAPLQPRFSPTGVTKSRKDSELLTRKLVLGWALHLSRKYIQQHPTLALVVGTNLGSLDCIFDQPHWSYTLSTPG